MRPAVWVLGLVLLLGGCGGEPEPFDPFAKQGAPTLPRRFHGRDLTEWLTQVDAGDASTRAEAAWAIGELGTDVDAHVDVLAVLLDDSDEGVRLAALHALQQLGRVPSALSARVLELFALDERLRWMPLATFGERMGDPDPAPLLQHEAREVRALLLWWLREVGPKRPERYVAPVLGLAKRAEHASTDEGPDAWRTLPHLGPRGVAVAQDRWRELLATADEGRLRTYLRSGVPGALAPDVVPLLERGGKTRAAAIEAISGMGGEAREALRAFVETTPDAEARQVARMLLLRLRSTSGD